jgi:hypothetical protein
LSGPQSDNSSGFVGGQSSFPGNGGGVLFEAVVPPAGIVPLDCFVCLFVCVCVCVCVCLKEKEGNGIIHTKQSGNKLLDDDIKRWDADGDGNDRVTVEVTLRYVYVYENTCTNTYNISINKNGTGWRIIINWCYIHISSTTRT